MQDILVVVDMQNDFIDGTLGTKEAVAIVPKVEEKIRNFKGTVLFTRDTHETWYLDTQEGKKLPVPHCIRNTEGWQIRRELDILRKTEPVDKETFGSTDLADELVAEDSYHPTYFEMLFLMGMVIFADAGVDYVTLETGLGGRLDATNVVPKPVLSVVTSIGMDHMHFLGNTIEAIAVEKGGIIKEKRPVVIGAGRQKAVDTLIRISLERQSEYAVVGAEDVHMTYADLFGGQQFDFGSYKELQTRMVGRCQPWNAAIAVKAVEMLGKMTATDCPVQLDVLPKDVLSEQVVRKGIASAYWQGRFEVMEKNPSLIIDGAHNPDGVQSLVDSMKAYLSDKPVILVMGVFADKDYRQMLEMVSDCSDTLIAFKPDNPRGLAAEQLKETAAPFFKRTLAAKSQAEALAIARKIGEGNHAIVCFGSLSTMAGWYQLTGRKSSDEEYRQNY